MNQLIRCLDQDFDITDMTTYLDSLNHDERLEEIRALGKAHQKKLFGISKKNLTINEMMPANAGPLEEIIFHGKNTLPLFSLFEKRMCYCPDKQSVFGYNHQTLMGLTGPGYYVVPSNADKKSDLLFDYNQTPSQVPNSWPTLKSNKTGLAKLVYGGLQDYLRQVSSHIFIGEALKKGKSLNNFFILCRRS